MNPENKVELSLLRLRVESSLYDALTDLLLAYPYKKLDFVALPINRHHGDLRNMNEQVSGFQQGYEFQVECWLNEAKEIDLYVQESLPIEQYEILVSPLIMPFWR